MKFPIPRAAAALTAAAHGGSRRLEADSDENHLLIRICTGHLKGVQAGIDHAHVRTFTPFHLEGRGGSGNAHKISESGDDRIPLSGEPDDTVDVPHPRSHTRDIPGPLIKRMEGGRSRRMPLRKMATVCVPANLHQPHDSLVRVSPLEPLDQLASEVRISVFIHGISRKDLLISWTLKDRSLQATGRRYTPDRARCRHRLPGPPRGTTPRNPSARVPVPSVRRGMRSERRPRPKPCGPIPVSEPTFSAASARTFMRPLWKPGGDGPAGATTPHILYSFKDHGKGVHHPDTTFFADFTLVASFFRRPWPVRVRWRPALRN